MFLDELQLFVRDVNRVCLDGVGMGISRRPVDWRYEFNRQGSIVSNGLERANELEPVPMTLTTSETVRICHVEVNE